MSKRLPEYCIIHSLIKLYIYNQIPDPNSNRRKFLDYWKNVPLLIFIQRCDVFINCSVKHTVDIQNWKCSQKFSHLAVLWNPWKSMPVARNNIIRTQSKNNFKSLEKFKKMKYMRSPYNCLRMIRRVKLCIYS